MSDAWIFIFFGLGLLLLGLVVGGINEVRHFRRLRRGEAALGQITVSNLKRVTDPETVRDASLILGQVVIATDTFKSWVTKLRNMVGGEMRAARNLMVRARREALLRLLREAEARGAGEVWNVRYEFCSISMMRGSAGAMQVEILAWGTAVTRS